MERQDEGLFNQSLYAQIYDEWSSRTSPRRRGAPSTGPITIRDLRTFVDVMFISSMKYEEGRPLRFAAALASPSNEFMKNGKYAVLVFEQKIPFLPDRVSKLAPAFKHSSSALLVAPEAGRSGELFVWGVVYFRNNVMSYEGGMRMMGATYLNPTMPYIVCCTVRSSGSLVLTMGQVVLGRVFMGEFYPSSQTPFVSSDSLLRTLRKMFRILPSITGQSPRSYLINGLERLLREASDDAHGATYIVVDEADSERAISLSKTDYRFQGSFDLAEIVELVAAKRAVDKSEGDLARDAFAERMTWVSHMGRIDGAVLLTSDLEPLSFATTLQAPVWNLDVITGDIENDPGGLPFSISRLGTRHKSAVNFVGSLDKSLAFVVSSDGPVRAFLKRDSSTIVCWPDCRRSMNTSDTFE